MPPNDSHPDEFEPEARERLSTIETRQETIQEDIEDLADGQDEILSALGAISDEKVAQKRLDGVVRETEANTEFRNRLLAVVKFAATTGTIVGGFSGVMVLVL